MKLRTLPLLVFLALLSVPLAGAQNKKPLTNSDVVQMVKAGFNELTVDKAIQANPTAFDTSVQALIALKNEGVSQNIIDTMLAAEAGKNAPAPAANAADTSSQESGLERNHSGKPSIYVEETSSTGGIVASSDSTLEAIKTLQHKHMHVVTIKEKADYVLQITRQRGKHSWRKDTKIALSNRNGDVVLAKSTRSVGGAMGDVVDYIKKHGE
jgi:hypothetical protein